MSSEKRRPPPAWRRDASAQPRDSRRGWRKRPAPARGDRARQSKIVVGVAALLLGNVLLLATIYRLWPPKPACLVLIGGGYENNLAVPHNVYGWNGLTALADFTQSRSFAPKWSSAPLRLKDAPLRLERDTDWKRLIDNFAEPTAIVFLSLHGGADDAGPYFLPDDADYSKECRLRVGDVLEHLRQLPPRKNKVLILDATQLEYHSPLGMLQNDFARGVNDLREQIESVPNLVVLSASDVDQRSWPAEAWGRTAFSHYVLKGLRGAADANVNGRVDALELHRYVLEQVEKWALKYRQARQTPVLLGKKDVASSIDLIELKDSPADLDPEAGGSYERPAGLQELWPQSNRQQGHLSRFRATVPHWLQQHQDLTLRYERLIRAGAEARGKHTRAALVRLSEAIARAQDWELQSLENTLALPAATGAVRQLSEPQAKKLVQELVEATPETATSRWRQEIAKHPSSYQQRLLRMQIGQLLLDWTAAEPRRNLATAARLLPPLGFTGNERPCELHFMALLHRDLDSKRPPPDELLRKGLTVSALAQRLGLALPPADSSLQESPYSEQVYPWIQSGVAQGDELRRRGEDRLFATDRNAWTRAEHDLDAAAKQYGEAVKVAEAIRQAAAVRDAAFAELTDLSSWLDARPKVSDSELKRFEALWQATHRLAGLLESAAKTQELARQTHDLRMGLDELRNEFERHCRALDARRAKSVESRQEIEAVLLVPWIEPGLRLRLIDQAGASARSAPETDRDTPTRTGEDARQAARTAARRRGRVTLARLDDALIPRPQLREGRDDDAETANLRAAGEKIAAAYRQLPLDVGKACADARSADAKQCVALIGKAELLARNLDSAGMRSLAEHPADLARRLRWHELLVAQAERTRHDHWFAESPAAEPYYVAARGRYLQDARGLLQDTRGQAVVAAVQARLDGIARAEERPGRLAVTGPERLDITSERQVRVEFGLRCDGWLPTGYPNVWIETGGGLRSSRERHGLEVAEPSKEMTVPFWISTEASGPARPGFSKEAGTVKLRGVYRGQWLEKALSVHQQRIPEITARQVPAPPKAALAVRAPPEVFERFALGKGAVAIIVDCSGSMLWSELAENKQLLYKGKSYYQDYEKMRRDYDAEMPCDYHEATAALAKVLATIQPGTNLSVFAFGQRLRGANQQPNAKDTIRSFRDSAPWRPEQLQGLMADLLPLEPWNDSPTLRAMLKAKRAGFPADFRGFKTILVLTDDEDSEFKNDAELNPGGKATVHDFIQREFKDEGIVVKFVGYKVKKKSKLPRFQAQLENPFEQLPLGSELIPVDRPEDLVANLTRALQQELRFQIERDSGGSVAGMPPGGWPVQDGKAGDSWAPLDPGTYRVRIQADRSVSQRVFVGEGERLMLSLSADGTHLERALIGNSPENTAPKVEKAGWQVSLLPAVGPNDNALSRLVAIESQARRVGPRETLSQVRPQHVWFAMKPADESSAPFLVWANAPGFPAPAWAVHARSGAGTQLRVWWSNGRDYPPIRVPRAAGMDVDRAFAGARQVGKDSADKVTIEGIEFEDHEMETAPAARQTQPCLVVRLGYSQDVPVWVELDGVVPAGQEHRWYSAAGKYAAYFWDVRKEQASKNLLGLRIYSIEDWKRHSNTQHVDWPARQ